MDGKAMIRKIIHIIIWITLIFWFAVIMGFVSRSNSEILCGEIVISISDTAEVQFVSAEAVRKIIDGSGIRTQGHPVEGISTRDLEFGIERDPYVKNAEVYINVEGKLLVDIEQRRPLIRVMPDGRKGFYIDRDQMILPLSPGYSPMVLLLTGHVKIPETKDAQGNRMADAGNGEELRNLIGFAKLVTEHPFWSNQIVQLYRSPNGDYELIPRVGAHQVQFGSLDDYETKLENLKLLYDQGLKKYGWNSYDKINLKYSTQIICTKR
jgi:cell division protein FtsQ